MPRVLDLFCGAGGASMGYSLAGFEVVGVDINVQPEYPFEFKWADATTYPLDGFDFIHASPPCQVYSSKTSAYTKAEHKSLISVMRERLAASGTPYVIENVMGARPNMWQPILLCGAMFGMEITRHRLFEASPRLIQPEHPYCHGLSRRTAKRRGVSWRRISVTGYWNDDIVVHWREIMGMDWTWDGFGLKEAIPPVFTKWIGEQVMERM